MSENFEVINAMLGQGDWLGKVHEEMAHQKDILLLLGPAESGQARALARLCQVYRYAQSIDVPEALRSEYERLLDLHDYAAKEHGLSSDTVFLLRPQAEPGAQARV
jgi:hypothetical protein